MKLSWIFEVSDNIIVTCYDFENEHIWVSVFA